MPPDIRRSWEDCNVDSQAAILAYDQIRALEEIEQQGTMYKILAAGR